MSGPILYANSELAAGAWLATVPNLSASNVGTTLPKDVTTWQDVGFVQYSVVGGTPQVDTGMRMPVIMCQCWGRYANSNKPAWALANNLAESIYAATHNEALSHATLAAPSNRAYPAIAIKEAVCVLEPQRVPDDPGDAARYRVNVQLFWTEA